MPRLKWFVEASSFLFHRFNVVFVMKSIIRVQKHTSRYTVIDNTGLNDRRLSLKSRGLLGFLLTKPDDWEISVAGIVSSGPDGKDSVQAALKELERFGYAEYRTVRGEHGRLGGKKWVVFERSIYQSADNQPLSFESTDHRQPGLPTARFSDYRKNRLSGNPQQVSTVQVVSNDYLQSTDLHVHADPKKSGLVNENSVEQAPPVAARPPAGPVLFSETLYSSSPTSWHEALQLLAPSLSLDQSQHYFERCLTWSAKRGSKSADWPAVAIRFFNEDQSRPQRQSIQQPKQSKPFSNDTGNRTSNSPGIDTVRATDRAARFIKRNRLSGGLVD